MFRRAVVILMVSVAVATAAAFAFASDASRFRTALMSISPWSARGFSTAPGRATAPRAASLLTPPGDSASGLFCRFPGDGDASPPHGAAPSPEIGADSVLLEGQTTIPGSGSPAICSGQPVAPLLQSKAR